MKNSIISMKHKGNSLLFDDWDDVFNWREYIEYGRTPNSNTDDNGSGCGAIIFFMVVFLIVFYYWLYTKV